MATFTTGLTYTISEITLELAPEKATVAKWCADQYFNYTDYTTTGTTYRSGNSPNRMLASYEYEQVSDGYAWGWGWRPSPQRIISVTVSLPSPPTLLTPSDGATGQTVTPYLSWEAVPYVYGYQYAYGSIPTFVGATTGITSDTGVTATGLDYTDTYYWRVLSIDNLGSGAWSSAQTFTIAPLQPPVLLTPSAGATGQTISPYLSWNASAGATGYSYMYSLNADFSGSLVGTTTDTGSTISGLRYSDTYYWKALASDADSDSAWSSAQTFDTAVMAAPSLLLPSNGAINQPTGSTFLDWTDVSGSTGYTLYYGTDSGLTTYTATGLTLSEYTLAGLSASTSYYWKVRGSDGYTDGPWSVIRSFTTFLTAPVLETPTSGSTGQDTGTTTVNFADVSGATGYEARYDTDSAYGTATTVVCATSTTGFTGLTTGTTYYWSARATDGVSYGPWSGSWTFTTILEKPTLLSPSSGSTQDTGVTVDWSDVTGAISYETQYDTDLGFTGATSITGTTSTTGFTGLETGTTYYWRTQASDGVSTSLWSDPWSFTTTRTLDAPNLLLPADHAQNQQTASTFLDWDDLLGSTGYTLYYGTDSGFTTYTETGLTLSEYTLSGLSAGTYYFWKVRGSDGFTDGIWSGIRDFRTLSPPD